MKCTSGLFICSNIYIYIYIYIYINCIVHIFGNSSFNTVGLQIYKMINLGSNVIVYILKHCVFKCLT